MKIELYNDNFQNFKRYNIPRAQLVIADIPYNIGNNFYGSNPMWYKGGDRMNGESRLAGKAAFNSDFNFNIAEYFHFCNRLLKKEPKKGGVRGKSSDAPCMIVFCSFEQITVVLKYAEKYGFKHAACWLPDYTWEDIYHFSEEEIKQFEEIIRSTAHLIIEFSQEGGILNAANS